MPNKTENTAVVTPRSLAAFMAQNVKRAENVLYSASDRISQPFEIETITSGEYQGIRARCMIMVQTPDKKKGSFTQIVNTAALQTQLCVRCTAFPDLHNQELQDSFGVRGAEALLNALLLPGELEDYFTAVMKANGFKDTDDLVEEAKN